MDLLSVEKLFFVFIITSFCGWLIEVIGEFIKSKKFVNRGFLIGPICPVYGLGTVLITVVLTHYENDYFAIFILSMVLCGSLEYFTSYIMEKIFKARWWDYSNEKFNINGRICLETTLWFGIAGILIIKVINPFINSIIEKIPQSTVDVVFYTLLSILILDIIISFTVVRKIRKIKSNVENELKDNTEEISKEVRNVILEKSTLYRRVLEAFPHAFADKVRSSKDKITQKAIETKEKTINSFNNVKDKTKSNLEKSKELTKTRIDRIKRSVNKAKIVTIEKINQKKGN